MTMGMLLYQNFYSDQTAEVVVVVREFPPRPPPKKKTLTSSSGFIVICHLNVFVPPASENGDRSKKLRINSTVQATFSGPCRTCGTHLEDGPPLRIRG